MDTTPSWFIQRPPKDLADVRLWLLHLSSCALHLGVEVRAGLGCELLVAKFNGVLQDLFDRGDLTAQVPLQQSPMAIKP